MQKGDVVSRAQTKVIDESILKRVVDNMYFKYRGKTPTKEKWCEKKNENVNCDDFLDEMLNGSIESKENIVFETVGTCYVSWLTQAGLRGVLRIYIT